jgi:hypothetical protein
MGKSVVDFDTVRRIGLALPGVEESTAWGTPVLKVRGKIMAAIAINREAEPGTLMVRMADDDRDELLAADPDVYYLVDHYADGHAVLVRLSRVKPDVLRDLLGMAHKFLTRSAPRPSVRSKKRNW